MQYIPNYFKIDFKLSGDLVINELFIPMTTKKIII